MTASVRNDDLRSVAAALAGAAEGADVLSRTDLGALVDFVADDLIFDDPGLVAGVVTACLAVIEERDRSDLAPRLTYLLAQAKVMVGELDGVLDLIERARHGFEQQGNVAAALRTNFGRSNVLHESGRHQDALEVNDWVLHTLAESAVEHLAADDIALLSATAHQNRGSSLERIGLFDEALEAHRRAEDGFRRLGLDEAVGENIHNRGSLLVLIGRVGEALVAFRQAAAVFAEGGHRALHARTLIDSAEANLLRGEYARSLADIGDVRHVLETIDSPALAHRASLSAARAYLALNLFPEALSAYREAGKWLDEAGVALLGGHAHWGAALALAQMGDLQEARTEYAAASEVFASSGDHVGFTGVLLDSADASARAGDFADGLDRANRAKDHAIAMSLSAEAIRARLTVASLVLSSGRNDDDADHTDFAERADAELTVASADAHRLGLVPLQLSCAAMLGNVRLRQSRFDEARELLERAVDGFDATRATLTHEAWLGMYLHDKAELFDDLLHLELAERREDCAERCLRVIERGRSRSLDELMAGSIDAASGDESDITTGKGLRSELSAVYSELFDLSGRDPATIDVLRQRAIDLERQIGRLRLEHVDVRPGTAAIAARSDSTPGLPLDPSVPIISYAHCRDSVIAVVLLDGAAHIRELGPVSLIVGAVRRLEAQWDRFRIGNRFEATHSIRLEQSTRRVLNDLYRLLIEPLEPILNRGSATSLVVIPFGPLHRVPFNALHDGHHYLVESMEISTAPSVASYVRCEQLAPHRDTPPTKDPPHRALIVGVADYFATDVRREVEAVARCYDRADVLCDEEATAEQFLQLVNGRTMVHLACHGMFRSDNPMYSSLRLGDRWITALELFGTDLTGATVILSACESARSVVAGGDEVMGMTRVFLASRAASLIASLWPADDIATTDLMTHLHRSLPYDGPVKALRSAQLALIGQQLHPYYWAPFQVIGAR